MRVLVLALSMSYALVVQGQPVNSVTLRSPVPFGPVSVGARVTGFTGQGPTLYYWVVARYVAGSATPVGPAQIPNTPGAGNLSATQFVTVSWPSVSGATGYDVIRGATPAFPAPCTACAVVLNTLALSVNDTGAALSAYPPAGLPSAQSTLTTLRTNGRDYTTPAILVDKQPGGTQIIPTLTNVPVPGEVVMLSGSNGQARSIPVGGSGGACPTCELTTHKDAAGGYPSLDSTVRVPANQVRDEERYSWVLCAGIPCVVGNDITENHVLVARTNTLTACYAKAKTAATGADIRIVINRQGVNNVFTTFITIPDGSTSVVTETGFSASAALTAGQFMTLDVTQVGSVLPGQGISVTCVGTQP